MSAPTPKRSWRDLLRAVLDGLARGDYPPDLVQCGQCWGVTPNDEESIVGHDRWHLQMRLRP